MQHLLHFPPVNINHDLLFLIYFSSFPELGLHTLLHTRQATNSLAIPSNALINSYLLQIVLLGKLDAFAPIKD